MRTQPFPVIFVGHGSPMNAIEDNEFSRAWEKMAGELPRPTAMVCVSAHWETAGTFVTAMLSPKTIHDFGGSPVELNSVQYPAPGAPDLAERVSRLVRQPTIHPTLDRGLDHGAWSVLRRMYPAADVPVIQLRLDYTQDASWHCQLGRDLRPLRDEGVLLVGSGNIVHNLSLIA